MSTRRINRRHVLRGLGVSLALPWLESVPCFGAEPGVREQPDRQRYACLFMANGVAPEHWWAKGSGADMKLGPSLVPLEDLKQDINVLQRLYHPNGLKGEQHVASTPCILTGAQTRHSTTELASGTSIDQEFAKVIGRDTVFPSLVLGIEPVSAGNVRGWSRVYSSHVSWSDAFTPVPRENNPRSLYDRLVGDPDADRRLRSVLDLIADDARSMQRRLSREDGRRMDSYLTNVREIEKRVERASSRSQQERVDPRKLMKAPPLETPASIPERMRLMLDLMVLAFQADLTRVQTFMFNNDLSRMDCSFVSGLASQRDMHGSSHRGGKGYQQLNRWHVEQYGYFLRRLKNIDEGGRSLLDNSCIQFCSNLMGGGAHERTQLPVLLAGKAGGQIETGRSIDFRKYGNDGRRLSNLYLSLFQRFGIKKEQFSDSNGLLQGF